MLSFYKYSELIIALFHLPKLQIVLYFYILVDSFPDNRTCFRNSWITFEQRFSVHQLFNCHATWMYLKLAVVKKKKIPPENIYEWTLGMERKEHVIRLESYRISTGNIHIIFKNCSTSKKFISKLLCLMKNVIEKNLKNAFKK